MKNVIVSMFLVVGLVGCSGELATCPDSAYPELCGSVLCEEAVLCCESGSEGGPLGKVCEELSEGLAEVPEPARQLARDVACEQIVDNAQDQGMCLESTDAGASEG